MTDLLDTMPELYYSSTDLDWPSQEASLGLAASMNTTKPAAGSEAL